jgi:hypothetical protein
VVKDRVVVEEEVLGVTPLGPDDVGTLDGVATEEDRLHLLVKNMSIRMITYKVQTDDIVVALHGVELDSEAAWVAGLISILPSRCHGREPNEDGGLLAYAGQEVGFLVLSAVVGSCWLGPYS